MSDPTDNTTSLPRKVATSFDTALTPLWTTIVLDGREHWVVGVVDERTLMVMPMGIAR